ncbi:putative acylpyruvase FAHD1 mitochondrial, partial [Bienertia sinuspersici]
NIQAGYGWLILLERVPKLLVLVVIILIAILLPCPRFEPVLFLKPTSSYLANGGTIEIPTSMEHLCMRLSLLLLMARKLVMFLNLRPWIMLQIFRLCFRTDMTAKELQATIKATGLPWLLAKGLDTLPIREMISKNAVPDPHNLELWLKVDGELKQIGPTSDMIFKFPYLISHISTFMTLTEGDVILIGTPEGIGPVKPGQKITAGITGLIDVHLMQKNGAHTVSN